jgi:hypothetical protein
MELLEKEKIAREKDYSNRIKELSTKLIEFQKQQPEQKIKQLEIEKNFLEKSYNEKIQVLTDQLNAIGQMVKTASGSFGSNKNNLTTGNGVMPQTQTNFMSSVAVQSTSSISTNQDDRYDRGSQASPGKQEINYSAAQNLSSRMLLEPNEALNNTSTANRPSVTSINAMQTHPNPPLSSGSFANASTMPNYPGNGISNDYSRVSQPLSQRDLSVSESTTFIPPLMQSYQKIQSTQQIKTEPYQCMLSFLSSWPGDVERQVLPVLNSKPPQ